MIYYIDGYEFDSAKQQELHGLTFPPFFFDTPAAREHWGVTEHPEIKSVETISEIITEPAILNEEEVPKVPQKILKPKKGK
jgi:hypothetical protein